MPSNEKNEIMEWNYWVSHTTLTNLNKRSLALAITSLYKAWKHRIIGIIAIINATASVRSCCRFALVWCTHQHSNDYRFSVRVLLFDDEDVYTVAWFILRLHYSALPLISDTIQSSQVEGATDIVERMSERGEKKTVSSTTKIN